MTPSQSFVSLQMIAFYTWQHIAMVTVTNYKKIWINWSTRHLNDRLNNASKCYVLRIINKKKILSDTTKKNISHALPTFRKGRPKLLVQFTNNLKWDIHNNNNTMFSEEKQIPRGN